MKPNILTLMDIFQSRPFPHDQWHPSASLATLKKRADLIWNIHHFFRKREVLSIETPLLSHAATTDPHLTPYTCCAFGSPQSERCFLSTSPEFAMKRLLCAGYGSIYQISKAFRAGDLGRLHNPEFTLLEWYRLNFTPEALMQETIDLISALYQTPLKWTKRRYQELFETYLNLDPLTISIAELKHLSQSFGLHDPENELERSTYLNFLFSAAIEPNLGRIDPLFVTHFPIEQALLAQADPKNPQLALRFELYHHGIELANGFCELQEAATLKKRMSQDNQYLSHHGLPERPIDKHLIEAHHSGLPACCGIALGLDRLFMQILKKQTIQEVMSFSYEHA